MKKKTYFPHSDTTIYYKKRKKFVAITAEKYEENPSALVFVRIYYKK
jgi:hypothetical protein